MKVKNISDGNFNLASGVLKPGEEGTVTFEEFKVLYSSDKIEYEDEPVADEPVAAPKPAPKPAPKKAAPNG